MPVRKRRTKARVNDVAAWAEFLMWGNFFFDELAAISLTNATAMPLAEKVWHPTSTRCITASRRLIGRYGPSANWATR